MTSVGRRVPSRVPGAGGAAAIGEGAALRGIDSRLGFAVIEPPMRQGSGAKVGRPS